MGGWELCAFDTKEYMLSLWYFTWMRSILDMGYTEILENLQNMFFMLQVEDQTQYRNRVREDGTI